MKKLSKICFLIFFTISLKAQDTLLVSVTHGYKTKRKYWKQDKPLAKITGLARKSIGGLRGGHVEVHVDGLVYGFTDIPNAKIPHIFPRKRRNLGLFTAKEKSQWNKNHQNDKITYFYIPVIKEQILLIQEKYVSYIQNAPYDFALFGKRCASSCYEVLMQSEMLDKKSDLGINLGIFHPRKFRKVLRKQALRRNISIEVQEGFEQKKWDNR